MDDPDRQITTGNGQVQRASRKDVFCCQAGGRGYVQITLGRGVQHGVYPSQADQHCIASRILNIVACLQLQHIVAGQGHARIGQDVINRAQVNIARGRSSRLQPQMV